MRDYSHLIFGQKWLGDERTVQPCVVMLHGKNCSLSTGRAFSVRHLPEAALKQRGRTSNLHLAQVEKAHLVERKLCSAPWQRTITQFLCHPVISDQNPMTVVPPSSVFTGFSTYDFGLFPILKFKLKECHFNMVEAIQTELQTVLDTFTEADFQKIFQQWKKHWDRCTCVGGNYSERNSSQDK